MGGGQQRQGQVVTISTSTSANTSSSLLTTAAEAGHAALHRSKTPDSPLSTAAGINNNGNQEGNSTSPSSPAIPTEIQMRKPHHLSLFNLLGGEDMEAVYTAMSRMLQREVVGTVVSAPKNAMSSVCRSKGNDSSSSSGESFVKSDLTRSTEEYSGTSSGNDVSNTEGEGGSSGSQGGSSGGGSPNPEGESGSGNGSGGTGGSKRCTVDHWTGSVKHNRRKNQMVRFSRRLGHCVINYPLFAFVSLSTPFVLVPYSYNSTSPWYEPWTAGPSSSTVPSPRWSNKKGRAQPTVR